jgi:hypothetical protein
MAAMVTDGTDFNTENNIRLKTTSVPVNSLASNIGGIIPAKR